MASQSLENSGSKERLSSKRYSVDLSHFKEITSLRIKFMQR